MFTLEKYDVTCQRDGKNYAGYSSSYQDNFRPLSRPTRESCMGRSVPDCHKALIQAMTTPVNLVPIWGAYASPPSLRGLPETGGELNPVRLVYQQGVEGELCLETTQ